MNTLSNTQKFAFTSVAAASLLLATTAFAHGHGPRGEDFFKHLDANSDGKVTLAEVKQNSQARFTETDTNKDGKITREEIKAQFEKHRAEHAKARGGDDNARGKGNGKAWGEGHGPKHGDFAARFFDKIDTNGDGAIDKNESAQKAEQMFAHMDDNGDGVVTQDELKGPPGCRGGKGWHKGHGKGHSKGGAPEGAAGQGA